LTPPAIQAILLRLAKTSIEVPILWFDAFIIIPVTLSAKIKFAGDAAAISVEVPFYFDHYLSVQFEKLGPINEGRAFKRRVAK
jgi:hypothetical protein